MDRLSPKMVMHQLTTLVAFVAFLLLVLAEPALAVQLRQGRPRAPSAARASARASPSPSTSPGAAQSEVRLRKAYPSSSGRSSQWAFKLCADDIACPPRRLFEHV